MEHNHFHGHSAVRDIAIARGASQADAEGAYLHGPDEDGYFYLLIGGDDPGQLETWTQAESAEVAVMILSAEVR